MSFSEFENPSSFEFIGSILISFILCFNSNEKSQVNYPKLSGFGNCSEREMKSFRSGPPSRFSVSICFGLLTPVMLSKSLIMIIVRGVFYPIAYDLLVFI